MPSLAPASALADKDGMAALRGTVLPFVFRRYLDYGVFESLRVLHRQIREHAARRAAGNPGRANDVKLSRGGIREIESRPAAQEEQTRAVFGSRFRGEMSHAAKHKLDLDITEGFDYAVVVVPGHGQKGAKRSVYMRSLMASH